MRNFMSACVLLSFIAATASPAPVLAQSGIQSLEDHMRQYREKVVAKRDSAMRTLIPLTEEQGEKFWPLQEEYDKELKQLGKKDRALLREFAGVHDKMDARTAEEMGQRFFAIKRERLALQEKYLKRISDEVSPVAAVLFLQLQRRFEAQFENERMKYSPLAE